MKIIIMIMLVITMISCDYVNQDDMFISNFDRIVYDENDIYNLVSKEIIYKHDAIDRWQTPVETWDKKTGDCEDKAILMIQLIYQELNDEAYLITVIIEGNGHAVVLYKGIIYDPTWNITYLYNDYPYEIIHKIGYNSLIDEIAVRRY